MDRWTQRLKVLIVGGLTFDVIMIVWVLNHWSRVTGWMTG